MTPGQYFTASMVRRLKGAPLAIYILLRISGKPEPAEYLEMYSGYSDKVVQKALLFLKEEQYITRNGRYSWQLSNYASQLPLMAQTGFLPEGAPAAGENEACDPSLMTLTGPEPAAGEADPEGNASANTGRESENLRLGISDSLARVFNPDNVKSINSSKKNLASDPENFRLLAESLDQYGIREPARSQIARIEGMTVELIEYHCSTCESTGQAIYRIKNKWPIRKEKNLKKDDDYHRYLEGPYSEWIEH